MQIQIFVVSVLVNDEGGLKNEVFFNHEEAVRCFNNAKAWLLKHNKDKAFSISEPNKAQWKMMHMADGQFVELTVH